MSARRKNATGGRQAREQARAKIVEHIRSETDALADKHMPYLSDATLDASEHPSAAGIMIEALEKKFQVVTDYRVARRHLAHRVVAFNKAQKTNLAVPPALTRSSPAKIRRTETWCNRRRRLNAAHEALMLALNAPIQRKLSSDERLGLVLYFAVTYGGLGDHRAVAALRHELEGFPKVQIHRGMKIAYIWVCYESKGACNAIVEDKLVVYRPWLVTTPCRLPLLGFLKSHSALDPAVSEFSDYDLIQRGFAAASGVPLPIKSFRKFCGVGSAIYERQDGVDMPEILVQIGNGQIDCLSSPPGQWEALFVEYARNEVRRG